MQEEVSLLLKASSHLALGMPGLDSLTCSGSLVLRDDWLQLNLQGWRAGSELMSAPNMLEAYSLM
jgi:hypothetical protein